VVALVAVALVVPPVAVWKHLFKAWIKDWEWACWERKDDPEAIPHLLLKYHGLHWLDESIGMLVAKCDTLEWKSGHHERGYQLIGVRDNGSEYENLHYAKKAGHCDISWSKLWAYFSDGKCKKRELERGDPPALQK
jgi:hypothetical protein